MSGRVLDDAGRVVTRAFVRAVSYPEGRESSPVITGNNGEFAVTDLEPGRYRLRVFTGRHQRLESGDLSVANGQSLEGLILTVDTASSVDGRVVDHGGHPLAGARIGSSDPNTGIGTSDGTGRFHLSGIAAGEVNLFATLPGFAPARQRAVRAGSRDVTLVLEPEATLSGLVKRFDGSDSLLVSVCHFDSFFDKELCVARQIVTRAEPGFVFAGLAAGEFELVLGDEGDEHARVPLVLEAGRHTDLALDI